MSYYDSQNATNLGRIAKALEAIAKELAKANNTPETGEGP